MYKLPYLYYNSLTKRLLETTISAIAFNASSTLDKNHGDKLVIQKIAERVKKITKN